MKKATIEQVRKAESKLKPCPFCGSRVSIEVCDCEGNTQGDDYLRDPWSGLSFSVLHPEYDCIIGGELDTLSFSLDDLVDAWNARYDR